MSLKILATADIHIGRRPSKLPDEEDAARFSAARMWQAIVDVAISERVDLVALAGDVVDHDNRFFEATGPLERGLARLAERGIHTYAVAGNHDYDVLQRIAEAIGSEYFHLLGRGGHWEEARYTRRRDRVDGGQGATGDGNGTEPHQPPRTVDPQAALKIHGWSFPAEHVEASPMAGYDLAADDHLPTLGLLHADLDIPQSSYAPVLLSELESAPLTIWLIGHVHRPKHYRLGGPGEILTLGSPQSLDPGEPGRHGPWLIEIHGPNRLDVRQVPLSKVRYDQLTVDITGVESEQQFQLRIAESTREHLKAVAKDSGALEYLSLRLELVGRTPLCSRLDEQLRRMEEEFGRSAGSVTAGVEKVINNTAPAIDLEQLAQKHDAPGVLARCLIELESPRTDESLVELLDEARRKVIEVHTASVYGLISSDPPPRAEQVRRWLIQQGRLLLDRLLAQEGST